MARAAARRRLGAVSRFSPPAALEVMIEKLKPAPAEDLRCPHCRVVVLKKERIDARADRQGAPEFCPRCGEPTGLPDAPR